MATDPATAPARSRPDPTRRLWQFPALALGVTAALAVHNGWLPVGKADPGSVFLTELAALRSACEKPAPDAADLAARLGRVASQADAFPEHAAAAHFALGSGYARLAEVTPTPADARALWTVAKEHLDRTAADRLPDAADPPRLAFRAAKVRAALGLPATARPAEVELLRMMLLKVPAGEEPGEANRLVAELYLRSPNPPRPDLEKAREALTVYLAEAGLGTPPASLFRAKLVLCRVHLKLGDAEKARLLLGHLKDAPADVKAPARAELARIYMAEANWAKAADEWEQVRATAPLPPGLKGMAAYHLGLCRLLLGKPDIATPLFEEAARSSGPESPAGSVRLAELRLKTSDPAKHKEAVPLLAAAVKPAGGGTVDQLVPEHEVRAAFETAVQVLVKDAAYDEALRVAEAYTAVATAGRDAEKRAEVQAAWAEALKKAGGDAAPKFAAAAGEYAALAKAQSAPSAKADLLRRAAHMHRAGGNPQAALVSLGELTKLTGVPDEVAGPAWYEYAEALLAAGKPDEVLGPFKQAMASGGPTSTTARYRLARLLLDSRDPRKAPLGVALLQQIAEAQQVSEAEQPAHERAAVELAHELIRAGDYVDAEARLRKQLDIYRTGPEAGLGRLLLGVCLLQRSARPKPDAPDPPRAAELREEARLLFVAVGDEVAAKEKAGTPPTDRDKWLRTQAGLRVLKAYYEMGRPDGVMKEAAAVIDRTRGTVEELIALSLVYHAHRQSNRQEVALSTKAKMREVFEELKRQPGAFPAAAGEWSREYWEKVWFAPTTTPGPVPPKK